jgi:hypothetical protein
MLSAVQVRTPQKVVLVVYTAAEVDYNLAEEGIALEVAHRILVEEGILST